MIAYKVINTKGIDNDLRVYASEAEAYELIRQLSMQGMNNFQVVPIYVITLSKKARKRYDKILKDEEMTASEWLENTVDDYDS